MIRLEARVFDAERRLVPAILNFIETRRAFKADDVRRKAARNALIWCFFPFNNAASAAGFLGLFLTVATVFLAYRSNEMVQQELSEITRQNDLTRKQFDLAQQQFDKQRKTEAQRRQTELLLTLNSRKDCQQISFRTPCPFSADGQARVHALSELSALQQTLSDDSKSVRSMLASIDLSGIAFPSGIQIRDLVLDKANLNHAVIKNATFSNIDFSAASYLRALVTTSIFEDANLSYADLRSILFESTAFLRVDFSKSKLNGSSFTSDIMHGRPTMDNPTTLVDVDFSYASLRGVVFRSARLTNCNFSHADLTGAIFSNEQIELLDKEISTAAKCPNGEKANGSCRGKMTPILWTDNDSVRLARYIALVESDLARQGLDDTGPFADHYLTVDIDTAPEGQEPLGISVVETSLDSGQLATIQKVLVKNAQDYKHGFRAAERVIFSWVDGLTTIESVNARGSFRSTGCINQAPNADEEGYHCNEDRAVCMIRWPPGIRLAYIPSCSWDSDQEREVLDYIESNDRRKIRIVSLGAHSLLMSLGFKKGDIVEEENTPDYEWPPLKQSQFWEQAATTRYSEIRVYKYTINRGKRRLQKTVKVVGRALDPIELSNSNEIGVLVKKRPGFQELADQAGMSLTPPD